MSRPGTPNCLRSLTYASVISSARLHTPTTSRATGRARGQRPRRRARRPRRSRARSSAGGSMRPATRSDHLGVPARDQLRSAARRRADAHAGAVPPTTSLGLPRPPAVVSRRDQAGAATAAAAVVAAGPIARGDHRGGQARARRVARLLQQDPAAPTVPSPCPPCSSATAIPGEPSSAISRHRASS